MIAAGSQLRLERIPIERIICYKHEIRFPNTLNSYIDLLISHPECEPEPLHVSVHPEYAGLYRLENGYHRFMAAVATGRKDVLCIVEEEVRT